MLRARGLVVGARQGLTVIGNHSNITVRCLADAAVQNSNDEWTRGKKEQPRGPAKKKFTGRQPEGIRSNVLAINRVQKVTKGGTTMNFSALVVAGNTRGAAGYGVGKADTVRGAVNRAFEKAWNNFVYVDRYGDRTLFHDVQGRYGSTKVLLRSAREGKGLKASNVVRSTLAAFGIHDCVSKCFGQRNPFAVTRATFEALQSQESPHMTALKTGKRVMEL